MSRAVLRRAVQHCAEPLPWSAVECRGVPWRAVACRGVPWRAVACLGFRKLCFGFRNLFCLRCVDTVVLYIYTYMFALA